MAKHLLDTEMGKGGNALSLERFVRLLLLHGQVTRMRIGEQSGFSPASVTQKSKWLGKHGFINAVAERREHSKRPVETLSLAVQPWVALAVRLCAAEVSAQLVDSTSAVVVDFVRPMGKAPTQRAVFAALGGIVTEAQQWAQEQRRPLAGVVLGVDGVVSNPVAGMVHSLNGIADWMPCAPKYMHPQLLGLPLTMHWTQIGCKLHGLARQLGTDDRIAYVEIYERDLHFALMQNGIVRLGSMGTSGHFLHQSVGQGGGDCYCGRHGCLDALLRAGQAGDGLLFAAVDRQIEKFGIRHLGFESARAAGDGSQPYANDVLENLVCVADGRQIACEGSALLAAESVLLHQMHAQQD